MKAQIKSSLDKIKAEDELVKKTENMLQCAYEKQTLEKKKHTMPVRAALAAAITLCAVSVGGFSYYKTPVGYVSLDINPSVELSVNHFNRIVSAEPYNKDGEKILESGEILNSSVKEAVSDLVKSASSNGYIKKDGSTVILVTAETKDASTAARIGAEAVDGAKDAVLSSGKPAAVYNESIDISARDEAKELGISPGKLNLIKKLQALDPNIKIEEYKYAEVSAIMRQIAQISVASNQTANPGETGISPGNVVNASSQQASGQNSATVSKPSLENGGSGISETAAADSNPVKSSVKVISVRPIGNQYVVVKYSGKVGSSALNTANYRIDGSNSFSKAVFLTKAMDEVKLTIAEGTITQGTVSDPEDFNIKISGVIDGNGNDVKEDIETVKLYENISPYVEDAYANDLTHVIVEFSEAVYGNITPNDFTVYTESEKSYRIYSVGKLSDTAWLLTVEEMDPDIITKAGTSKKFDGVDANGNKGIAGSLKTVKGLNY